MGSFIAETIAFILESYLDIKFWFKKRKRRKFEKENNLPKKLMVYPSDKIHIIFFVIVVVLVSFYMFFIQPSIDINRTEKKLNEISQILEKEKQTIGHFPKELKAIIRNNPLRKSIVYDAWDNEIQYNLEIDEQSYVLFSVGKDGLSNTEDDIYLKH